MLAITTLKQPQKASAIKPNILPCKITHSGPIPASKRHWNPQPSSTNPSTQTAYFRGRKLQGRTVALPEGYEGKLLVKTETLLPQNAHRPGEDDEEEEEALPVEVKQAEQISSFDSIVVWAHEAVAGSEDAYVQGLVEWPQFAESIHAYDMPATTT